MQPAIQLDAPPKSPVPAVSSRQAAQKSILKLVDNVENVIVGKRAVIELAVIALLCKGHVLLEDVPGTGKTMLARALARSMALDMKRLQCTPDLLPSDITGVPVFQQKNGEFEFRPGPVFTNLLLADEINRATPRAQSALLECMAEHHVSVDGKTYAMQRLFMVLATQNPVDMAGTHALPEAQLDRFFVRLSVGYPSLEEELRILLSQSNGHPIDKLMPVAGAPELLAAREAVKTIHIAPSVLQYIARITAATRDHPELRLGASPRGTLALASGAQGLAFIRGKDYVTPDAVKAMSAPVLAHRLLLKPRAAAAGRGAAVILKEILDKIAPPV